MVTIIKTEFMKLKRYFIVWIGVSLMLLTVLLTLFTTMADDGMVWDYQFLFEQVVKHFVTMIFPMCITLISGYMISREYTDDTLKNIETLPISFRKLLAGKLIVSAILSLFLGIVCFAFTVVANFIMGYDGFALIPALTGLVQMALLGLFLYLTMLPIIVLTSRHKGSFLVGVGFVLGQILSNALKYTKKGKISIYMSKSRPHTLVIEDTGIGIRAEDLPRVFEKGFTGYNGREENRSTGIGLYLCGKIMKRLDHGIRIESELGKGTKVFLELGRKKMDLY